MKMNIFDWQQSDELSSAYCSIAAAAITAAASVGGAAMSANASKKAAATQAQAAAQAQAAQREMFDISRSELQPFINAGKETLPNLQNWNDYTNQSSPLAALLKLTTPGADMSSTLEQTPGFQFASQYGQKAVQNTLAARGLGGPGGALARGSADYATGLAGTQWSNIVDKLLGTYTAGGTQLQNVAGLGANSAGNLAGAAGQAGSGIASTIASGGNAQAGSQIAQGQAWAGAANNVGASLQNAMMLNRLSGLYGRGGGSVGDPMGF